MASPIDAMALTFLSVPPAERAHVLEIWIDEYLAEAVRRKLSVAQARATARQMAEELFERIREIEASGGDRGPTGS